MPPAARARRSDKPSSVGLNLDTLKREGAVTEPFSAVLGGKHYEFSDPNEWDWQEMAAAMADSRLLIRMSMSQDDAASFLAQKAARWQIEALGVAWAKHYGLDIEGLGEGDASLT